MAFTWPRQILLLIVWCSYVYAQDEPHILNTLPEPSEAYLHSIALDEYNRYFVYWKFTEETITFEIHARTLGWVGLGLSPNGGMKGADIFLGWVKDGQTYGHDRYAAEDKKTPEIDKQQDWNILFGREERGFTVIKIQRKRITCDEQDQRITGDTARMIFAWNDADPDDSETPLYHGATQRGTKSVYLIEYGKSQAGKQPNNTKSFDMLIGNVNIPADDTVYMCRLFQIPHVEKKHHLIGFSAIIDKENIAAVHHMVVYGCHKNLSHIGEYSEKCYSDDMPVDMKSCDMVVFGWAVGMNAYELPDVTGLPVGGENDISFLLLEIHYDNPQLLTTIQDNSGIRVAYTSELRRYDAATAMVGEVIYYPPMIIPPNAENFTIESYCSGDCTKAMLPRKGINVFASFLHTHLLGAKIWTKHVRNGKELPEIARDDHYDFNFQQYRPSPTHTRVLPGDDLITTCVYNSKKRTNVTFSGSGTKDEMCINFMFYYPKTKFSKCVSLTQDITPVYNYVIKKAMTGEIHIDPEDAKDQNKTVYHYLDSISWTENEVEKFQQVTSGSHRYREYCTAGKANVGSGWGVVQGHRPRIVIDEPYVIHDVCAKETTSSGTSYNTTFLHMLTIILLQHLLKLL